MSDSARIRLPLTAALLAVCGCSGSAPVAVKPRPPAPESQVVDLDTGSVNGLSGLARDGRDGMLAVAERDRVLLPLTPDGQCGPPMVLSGIPDGVDTEAAALLGPDRVALGIEGQADWGAKGPLACDVALVRLYPPHRAVREACLRFPYRLFDVQPRPNNGVEGLCRAGRWLLAALETVGQAGGRRFAPVGIYDLQAQRWKGFQLMLTSDTGKAAALDCALGAGGEVQVLAVERHFGVGRLLAFSFDPRAPARQVQPRVALDLLRAVPGEPNLEGLARQQDGTLVLVNDNQYGQVSGPNRLYRVPLPRGTVPPP
jgi:hypothetical protein